MKTFGALLLFVMIGLGSAADLHALRCGNDLILKGDLKVEVLRSCGEPVSVESWTEIKTVPIFRFGILWHTIAEVTVEEWVYNLGPHRFMRIIRFENGRVDEITTADYGY